MQITWVAFVRVERIGNRFDSSLASARYRMIIPAAALERLGHGVQLIQVNPDSSLDHLVETLRGEVAVMTKLLSTNPDVFRPWSELALGIVRAARQKGMSVVCDVCDDHFGDARFAAYYRELVTESDLVVASTPRMAEITRAHTPRPIQAISDPYEGARQAPRVPPPPPKPAGLLRSVLRDMVSGGKRPALRLLWFGHGGNLGSVVDMLPRLAPLAARYAVDLHIVTSADTGAEGLCESANKGLPRSFRLRFSPWSTGTTWRALDECDLVIIPARLGDTAKAVKSPNRLVESLWAGRFVCASPVPSYEEFGEFAWLGEDIASGIEWAVQHPREVMRKLQSGQDYISRHCSPEVIARQWEAAFLAARGGAGAAPQGAGAVKLNLGCGDKLLPGYVNVDIAESRGDVKPDVLCDLRRLSPFPDGTVDEVLSVHVVEHFWRWEVVDVLREWARVLRPGGRMILECPNLHSACEAFLRDPDAASGPGPEGQRTMWVFYGDPRWRDPLMVHRWGYTPHSLGRLMSEAGLVNVRQEPAQFKLREPRDMRMVGEKPA
ncbi:MAG: hypothetical protein A3I02_14860 [Betaproteobacteria bacterium RIFCSPLOWO2_02_FULL_67_26]|nr:MAG: hypothetical protein A3I02_14860 [Betaproteobacteria bacterium RIFCSPLOWO2_02_FULL_67_26]